MKTTLLANDSESASTAMDRMRPIAAYRTYLRYIAARDLSGVLACLAPESRCELLALCASNDFPPFFDVWCDSQAADIRIAGSVVRRDMAFLDVYEGNVKFCVVLRMSDGEWRVCSERRA